jgi:ABC-type nitrate/sulfonate/bicarbonate transport system permease component
MKGHDVGHAQHRVYRGAAGLVLLFGAAQLALWAGRVSPATFPLPSAVLGSAADLARNGSFLASIGSTMAAWAEAMAASVVTGVLAGLLLGSTDGIGNEMLKDESLFNVPGMWGIIVLLGLLLNGAFSLLEHRVLAWERGARSAT